MNLNAKQMHIEQHVELLFEKIMLTLVFVKIKSTSPSIFSA